MSSRAPHPSRIILPLLAAVAVVVAVVAIVGLALSDDSDEGEAGGSGSPRATATPLTGECENVHAGHGIAMWNPTMADEMTDSACPWPYEPFDPPLEGGAEDPALVAPFEPRRYDEIWQMLNGLDVGVCQVATLTEPAADGYAFGFSYAIGAPGCPDESPSSVITLREYVTRGWRDHHANRAETETTFVLGRWVVELVGADAAITGSLHAALVGLGAIEV